MGKEGVQSPTLGGTLDRGAKAAERLAALFHSRSIIEEYLIFNRFVKFELTVMA